MQMLWTVANLMRREVYVTSPDLPLLELARELVARKITGAPVLEAGRLVGVVSLVDVGVHALHAENLASLSVRDVMTTNVVRVERTAPLPEAAELFKKHRVHRLVVTEHGAVVGLLSAVDLLGVVIEASLAESPRPVPEPEAVEAPHRRTFV